MIYYGANENGMYAVDAATGEPKWQYRTSRLCRPPIIAGGIVYFPCYDGFMYAVDGATGKERWKLQSKGTFSSSPAIANGVLYFLNADGHMYALR